MTMTFRASDNHWHVNGYRERVTRQDAQSLLLGVQPFKNGEIHHWKTKHVGAGIYEVWLEPRDTPVTEGTK